MSGYRSYLKSDHWQNLRLQKLVNSGTLCFFCKADSISNDVHHVKYPKDLKETKLKHLRVLCRGCHEMVHSILKEYPAINKEPSSRARWRITVQHMNRRLGFKMPFSIETPEERAEYTAAMMFAKRRLRAARDAVRVSHQCNVSKKNAPMSDEFARWLWENQHAENPAVILMAAAISKTGFTKSDLTYRVRKAWWSRHLHRRWMQRMERTAPSEYKD